MAIAPLVSMDVQRLRELIKDIDVAMMTTVNHDGLLRSRPMVTASAEHQGDLWFFVKKGSPALTELEKDNRVNLSYANTRKNSFVSVTGICEIVEDPSLAAKLWKSDFQVWFPQGPADPDLRLVRVSIEEAAYWESPASAMVRLMGYVKSLKKPA